MPPLFCLQSFSLLASGFRLYGRIFIRILHQAASWSHLRMRQFDSEGSTERGQSISSRQPPCSHTFLRAHAAIGALGRTNGLLFRLGSFSASGSPSVGQLYVRSPCARMTERNGGRKHARLLIQYLSVRLNADVQILNLLAHHCMMTIRRQLEHVQRLCAFEAEMRQTGATSACLHELFTALAHLLKTGVREFAAFLGCWSRARISILRPLILIPYPHDGIFCSARRRRASKAGRPMRRSVYSRKK